MRPIFLVVLEKTRPALILTREIAIPMMTYVTVAPITSTIKGLSTEVLVDERNGVDHKSAISCDNILTVAKSDLVRQIGRLLPEQERELAEAIVMAYDLDI